MSTTTVEFDSPEGHTLNAFLDRPDETPRGTALIAHCFTCSATSPAASRVAQRLTERGFAVLRFDFTGLGGSGGDFGDTTFSSNVADLVAAANWMRATIGGPDLIIGHSLGGAAVLAGAEQIPGLKGVVTIAAPFDPEHVTGLFKDSVPDIDEHGSAEVKIGGQKLTIGKEFLDDIATIKQKDRIRALTTPLLIMHSPDDELVDVHNAQAIYRTAPQPKSFISLDGADHLLSAKDQAGFAADIIAAWAAKYLHDSPVEVPEAATTDEHPADAVRATRVEGSDFSTTLATARHRVLADEPSSVPGGSDLGPTPVDLLEMALAGCTLMTMGMYARRKGFELGETTVDVAVNQSRDESGAVTTFKRTYNFDDALDGDQRASLRKIANKCPVHRILEGKIEFED